MQKIELPVAFFDSGLGGISVLRETVRLLPQEDYLYFGDSLHAPYGVKSVDEVVRLSLENAAMLTARGIKALVVACNTVTSAAIRSCPSSARSLRSSRQWSATRAGGSSLWRPL